MKRWETRYLGDVADLCLGKMLDEKITLEGMVTICLQTAVINDQNLFVTKNNGNTTVKSPMGMFDSDHIENDLNLVDQAICEFYGLPMPQAQNTQQQQQAAQNS